MRIHLDKTGTALLAIRAALIGRQNVSGKVSIGERQKYIPMR